MHVEDAGAVRVVGRTKPGGDPSGSQRAIAGVPKTSVAVRSSGSNGTPTRLVPAGKVVVNERYAVKFTKSLVGTVTVCVSGTKAHCGHTPRCSA